MILCCGEALIDMIPAHTAEGRPAWLPVPGGAALNAAVALARLGCPAALVTALSQDGFGDRLRAVARESGVDITSCASTPRPTALAFVEDGPRYVFRDEGSAGREMRPENLPPLPNAPRAALFGGISLAADPAGNAFEALAARLASAHVPVILDLNIRPAAIRDAATYRARLSRMVGLAALVKASEEDLDWLAPGTPPRSAAEALAAEGPALIVLTCGAQGATALTAGRWSEVPALPVAVVDTVGAGDAFIAGLLTALQEADALAGLRDGLAPETLQAALAFGCRVAAVSVSRPGADPPWRREIC